MVLGRVQLEGFGPTRNRKVVGSNPTSGSKPQVRGHLWYHRLRGGDSRSFLWFGRRTRTARHVGVPSNFPPARWIGWHPRATELRSTASSNPAQAPSAAPNTAETGRRLPPWQSPTATGAWGSGDVLLLDPDDQAVGV